jgi:hypothetical protein
LRGLITMRVRMMFYRLISLATSLFISITSQERE